MRQTDMSAIARLLRRSPAAGLLGDWIGAHGSDDYLAADQLAEAMAGSTRGVGLTQSVQGRCR
jgi:hypothetical protein